MKIYRLEHKESRLGFWANLKNDSKYWDTLAARNINFRCGDNNHPTTMDDFGATVAGNIFNKGWAHGCHTLNHFYAWFEKDWYALIEYGFGLFEYNIEDNTQYIVGKSQIVFNQKAAISVREISIEEYEEALK